MAIGEFIFEYTSSAKYKRFARPFGGKLLNFKYTSNQIIQLSETIQALKNENNKFESLNLIEDSINAWQQHPSIKQLFSMYHLQRINC